MFLQTLQDTAIAGLHCRTEPFHIFRAGKLISFSLLPMYQPLPNDLLAGRIQLLHTLYYATSARVFRKRIRTVRLHFSLALHFGDLPGTPVVRDRQSTKSGRGWRVRRSRRDFRRLIDHAWDRQIKLGWMRHFGD